MIVLDTNIVLDAFVFNDPTAQRLKAALNERRLQWLSTQAMRDELERVLFYPKIAARLAFYQCTAVEVLVKFDCHAQLLDAAPKASVTCRDPDDQKFIDLAVAHQTLLLSKDAAVLCMSKRLLALGVKAQVAIN